VQRLPTVLLVQVVACGELPSSSTLSTGGNEVGSSVFGGQKGSRGSAFIGDIVVAKGRDSRADFILNKSSIRWFLVWIHKGID
jgi:hypothetical protein